jgi:hypothetical protein
VTCGRRVRWQGEVISAGREGREREPPMVVVPSHAAGRTGGRRKARAIASGAGGGTSSPPPLTRARPGRVRVHHPAFFTVRACQPARKMDSILCRPRTKIPLHVNYCTLYLDHFHVLYLGAAPRSNQCHFSPRYQVCLRVWHPEQAVLFLDEILPRSGLTTASFCFH